MRRFRWTTLTDAHRREDLPGARIKGPWLGRLFRREADPMKEAERVAMRQSEATRRREAMSMGHEENPSQPAQARRSAMVSEDQPRPVLKPSPALARHVDAASFNARWVEERRHSIVTEAKAARSDLHRAKAGWQEASKTITTLAKEGAAGRNDDAKRGMLDAFRDAKDRHDPAVARSRSITRETNRLMTR